MSKVLHRKMRKFIIYILIFILILSEPVSRFTVYAVTESDTADAIHIKTAEDFLSFAKNCSNDIWSHDKTFVLDNDIDLSGSDFMPVPSFGGIFLGQGHIIKGYSLTGGSNNMGLFRYIQESGEIYHLSVSAIASAESGHTGLGLIAGSNSGLISGCSTSGNITGKDQVGSMVGTNELTGVITDCISSGIVYGSHLTGGIAGENKGTILNSTNHCFINTTPSENNFDLSSFNVDAAITDFLTTENASSVTDIGGIAGSNSGVIQACTNDSSIGYQHVGYNIGGIAGSQTGYIEGCINYGLLNGRKDVGGIAGQMEPSSELEYSEDTLAKLNTELNKLHDLLTQLDRDASASSSALTGQIDQLLNSVEGAQNAVNGILDNASGYFNDFSNLTDLTTLPSPKPVSLEFLDDLASAVPTFTPSPEQTPTAAPSATPTATPSTTPDHTGGNSGSSNTSGGGDGSISGSNDETDSQRISHGIGAMSLYTEQGDFTLEPRSAAPPVFTKMILREPGTGDSSGTGDDSNPGSGSDAGSGTDIPWPSGLPTPSNLPSFSPNHNIDREQIEKDLNKAQQNIYEDASNTIKDFQEGVQSQASIISSRITSSRNSLSSSFSAIIDDMRLLNSMLDGENQILLKDLQAVVDELNVIGNLLTAPDTPDADDILTDVSDEDKVTDTAGKVMNCVNNGTINGDLNIGGIAGSLSRENNLDPENDLNFSENDMTSFRFKERIVIRQCQNKGNILGKKDCIGGIAGEMRLGSIIQCISSGTISGEGAMVGGIAGRSDSTIRSSSAKCTLEGKNQVGGIAGYGTTISDCYSMVQLHNGEYYLGSIAGKADVNGEIRSNYFVEGSPAGIDGISYEGKAQPLSYEEFMASPNLPDIFNAIYLTFVADDKTVSVVSLPYGNTFQPKDLPKVPEKEGYVGVWSDFDQNTVTFDQTIEAVYTEYITTLESSQTVEDRPVVLVEGTFGPEDSFTLSEINAYPEDSITNAQCLKIHISGISTGPYTIRYLIPAGMKHPQLEVYEDGAFHKIDAITDGSYYVFTQEKSEFTFSCTERPGKAIFGTGLIILVGSGLLILLILAMAHTKKKGGLSS